MKIVLICLLSIVVFFSSTLADSTLADSTLADSTLNENVDEENLSLVIDNLPFEDHLGFIRIEIRDSDDQLVGYTETHDFELKKLVALRVLEKNFEWKSIIIDGKNTEVLEFSTIKPLKNPGLTSFTKINVITEDEKINIIRTFHNGFLTIPGDKINATVVLVR